MKIINNQLNALLFFAGLILVMGCERELDDLELASYPTTAEVFIDAFSAGLSYAAFGGSDVKAFQVDTEEVYEGEASMRIAVPDFEDPAGAYAGGVYFTNVGRNLSGYNVLTFWAKASKAANIDLIGFGNDLGANRYEVAVAGLPVTTNWKKYYIPIPDPSKLTRERGMFFYSEGPEDGRGYTFWIDEVRFENLGTIAHAAAGIFDGENRTVAAETGATFQVNGFAEFNLPTGVDQRLQVAPAYFTYSSSNANVASVSPVGTVTVMDAGTAVITATLGELTAEGSLTINSTGAPVLPPTPAPTPSVPAEDVISIFSNAYNNVPVDFFNGYWEFSTAQTFDVQVNGDDIKRYTQLNFVGIQFTAPTINAGQMTHLHLDIWTPDPTDPPAVFKVLLVDIGPNGAFGGGDDSSHEITLASPTLQTNGWVSLDLPFASFPGLTSRMHLAQIVLSGDLPNVFVDNIFFYKQSGGGGGAMPTVAAPTPTRPAANVISLFSDAYDDVPVDTWRTDWSAAMLEGVTIDGNANKKYTALDFVGIETVANQIDASAMTHFHLDVWSADFTFFGVKLVDFGADGAFGGGDDVEHQINFDMPAQEQWVSYDIPLTDFTGLTTRSHVAQLILVGQPSGNTTVYVDNVYFYGEGGGNNTPTVAAPTPMRPAANVISLFSDAYDDVPVDTWRTDWSAAMLEDVAISGNATKKYSALDFVGIETVANQIDASAMTHFHLDVWSADFTVFGIKIVDFGADGAFGGGDDVEHQINFDMPAQRQWVSYDIPLTDFTGLTTRSHVAQYILVGQPSGNTTVYVDNVYFYTTSGGGNTPTMAAPTPTRPAANVISLFSDAYDDVPVDTWRTDWSAAMLEDVAISGNATKKYSSLDFVGIETVANQIDASAMTHFHLDVWSADFTFFGVKLVDFGADGAFGGGDDVEHQINFDMPAQRQWVSFDIPLSDFTGLTTRSHMAQYILVGRPSGGNTVYVDNVYFRN